MKLKTLNLKLACGEGVMFKGKLGYILIGGAGKDEYGDYRYSGYRNTKEECFNYIGCYSGYSQERLQEILYTHKYIDSYVLAYGDRVPVGTKVRILDNAKGICENNDTGCIVTGKQIGRAHV